MVTLPFTLVLVVVSQTITGVILTVNGASVGSGSSKPDCSDVQLAKCMSSNDINKFGMLPNEEDLDSICRQLGERFRCVDNYTRNCMDKEQRVQFNKVYLESSMVIQEFCSEGDEYRKEFLKHSPCLKNNRDAHDICAANYSRSLEEINSKATDSASSYNHIKSVCCSLQEYIRCSKESVRTACGEDTYKFAGRLLDRMVSGLVENHCQSHKIREECLENYSDPNAATSNFRPSFLIFILPVVSLLSRYL